MLPACQCLSVPSHPEEGRDTVAAQLSSVARACVLSGNMVCVSVLHRVRSWLDARPGEHSGLAQNIQASLDDYESKLSGLRATLQEAATQARKATGLNQDNERALVSIQVSPSGSAHGHLGRRRVTALLWTQCVAGDCVHLSAWEPLINRNEA